LLVPLNKDSVFQIAFLSAIQNVTATYGGRQWADKDDGVKNPSASYLQ